MRPVRADTGDARPARPATAAARVLYIHNSADMYGASRSLLRLLSALPRDRYEPSVVVPCPGPLVERLRAAGEVVHVIEPLGVITRDAYATWGGRMAFVGDVVRGARALSRLVADEGITLVHTNTGVVASAGLAARWAGVRHVWHVRDWFQEFSTVWDVYARYMRWSADRIVAVSGPVAGQFPSQAGVSVIHNGFSLDEFPLDAAAGRRFRDDHSLGRGPVIGCVGRIKLVRKGQEVLLQAARLLADRGYHPRYVIIGSAHPGNEAHQAAVRDLVETLRLQDLVTFTGEMEDVRPAYAAMDVLALPSAQPEPFGGVVMEAMAMGIPVVATAIGGSLEQVEDGVTGLLVPPGDPEALARALQGLLDAPARRSAMGEAGRRRVLERFSVEGMMDKLLAIYDDLSGSR